MLKNLFHHKNTNTIYKGTAKSASPVRECRALPTQAEANYIDRQEAKIRELERKAETDIMVRFYLYGRNH